ncbi:hypothetical protein V5F38_05010 [Xanthobacter sp. V0B-10]|uniref:hypothetical protein n=1 Tax=Xanthobacter albus TaxID=3119929 RepID=UPI0037298D89
MNYADYSALGFRFSGFGTGTAISTQLNTVWRQGAMGAHVLAQFTVDSLNADVPDNGVSYLPSYKAAIRSQGLNYAVAAGTPNAITVTLSPAISVAPAAGLMLRLLIATANTGGVTLNAGWGAAAVVTQKGAAVAAGDLQAGAIVTVIWTGTVWMLAGIAYSEPAAGSLLTVRMITASGTYTPTVGTRWIMVEVIGGGGAGAGIPTMGAGQYGCGAGGSSGTYAKAIYTSGFGSVAVTIGFGGGGSTGPGGSGGTTSFGSLLSCPGGYGGQQTSTTTGFVYASYGVPSGPPSGSGIFYSLYGGVSPNDAWASASAGVALAGHGAASPLGCGGGVTAPANATGYGAAGGGRSGANTVGAAGGDGAQGCIIVWEYN